jgi:hypothetical protein
LSRDHWKSQPTRGVSQREANAAAIDCMVVSAEFLYTVQATSTPWPDYIYIQTGFVLPYTNSCTLTSTPPPPMKYFRQLSGFRSSRNFILGGKLTGYMALRPWQGGGCGSAQSVKPKSKGLIIYDKVHAHKCLCQLSTRALLKMERRSEHQRNRRAGGIIHQVPHNGRYSLVYWGGSRVSLGGKLSCLGPALSP